MILYGWGEGDMLFNQGKTVSSHRNNIFLNFCYMDFKNNKREIEITSKK